MYQADGYLKVYQIKRFGEKKRNSFLLKKCSVEGKNSIKFI